MTGLGLWSFGAIPVSSRWTQSFVLAERQLLIECLPRPLTVECVVCCVSLCRQSAFEVPLLLVTYVEACDSCIVGLVTDDNFQAASAPVPLTSQPAPCLSLTLQPKPFDNHITAGTGAAHMTAGTGTAHIVAEPAPVPLTSQPAPLPLTLQPAPVPLTSQPAPGPLTTQPAPGPVTSQPARVPLTSQPAPVPAHDHSRHRYPSYHSRHRCRLTSQPAPMPAHITAGTGTPHITAGTGAPHFTGYRCRL